MRHLVTGPGQDALDALARRVDELRAGSLLDPAIIVCPNPVVAVGVRRHLGRRGTGVAGVVTESPSSLLTRLVRSPLARQGRHMASKAELLAAIRAELAAEPGRFGAVANHRTTDERLLAFHQELVGADPDQVRAMTERAEGLSADALRVVAAVDDRTDAGLSGYRLVELALAELESTPPGAFGPIIIYQPEPRRPLEQRLLSALAARSDCEVHLAMTGLEQADEAYLDRLARWGMKVNEPGPPADPARARRVEVADPGDEVAAAIRELTAQGATGRPLTGSAILYTTREPYASILVDQLEAASLPYGAPGHRPLAASMAGRALRRMLGLATGGVDRQSLMTFLSATPVRGRDRNPVPTTVWDRLSRRAGVIDPAHWDTRLSELASRTSCETDRAAIDGLKHFVEQLVGDLTPPDLEKAGWAELARWALDLVDHYLIGPGGGGWPEAEITALDRVHTVVEALAALDRVGLPADLADFEVTVVNELESVMMPGRPLGQGIHVGSVESAAGLVFDQVWIVGLGEGIFPREAREDPLLTDRLRSLANLVAKGEVGEIDLRAVALAAAGSHRPPVLINARGDLRANRARSWPRLLDPLVRPDDPINVIESHHQGLAGHGLPTSLSEHGLRALIGHVDGGEPVHTHPMARSEPALARGLERVTDRESNRIGPHSGRVTPGRVTPQTTGLSPTALETYAGCPRRYLLNRVLRIDEDDRPERSYQISNLDRGTLVHRILERFVGEMITDGRVPEPDQAWDDDQVDRLESICEQEVKQAESEGKTGGLVRTRLLADELAGWMSGFVETDNDLRRRYRSTPAHVEFKYRDDGSGAGWGGRELGMAGTVDRIDFTEDGGLLIVDYKTGGGSAFDGFEQDRLKSGARLQLPLYAHDTARLLNRKGPKVGVYWLLKTNKTHELIIDADVDTELDEAVGVALDGIESGLFPGIPGANDTWKGSFVNCRFCDYERVCPTDRNREWERIRHDPDLSPIHRLMEALDPELRPSEVPDG